MVIIVRGASRQPPTAAHIPQVVDYFAAHSRRSVPPQISEHMRPQAGSNGQHYLPIVHFNEFWMLKDKFIPVRDAPTARRAPRARAS